MIFKKLLSITCVTAMCSLNAVGPIGSGSSDSAFKPIRKVERVHSQEKNEGSASAHLDYTSTENYKTNPLLEAARSGNYATAEELLAKGFPLDFQDEDSNTPLMIASKHGFIALVELFLAHNAKINMRTCDEATALTLAAGKGYIDIVELLLNHGAAINAHDTNMKNTAIMLAARTGNEELVSLLLKHSPRLDLRNKYGETALNTAIRKSQHHLIPLLLDAQLKQQPTAINNRDLDKNTLLHQFAEWGFASCVDILLRHRADLNAHNKLKQTPLHMSAAFGHTPIAASLIANRADVNSKDTANSNPAHYAISGNHSDVLILLLNAGNKAQEPNDEGITPSELALDEPQIETMCTLIAHGINMKKELARAHELRHNAYENLAIANAFGERDMVFSAQEEIAAREEVISILSMEIPSEHKRVYEQRLKILEVMRTYGLGHLRTISPAGFMNREIGGTSRSSTPLGRRTPTPLLRSPFNRMCLTNSPQTPPPPTLMNTTP